MDQKYNVIVGVSFSGDLIAYSHDDDSYNVKYSDDESLLRDKELIFNEKDLYGLYNYLDTDDLKDSLEIAKNCTFKLGQSNMLNNPFKK